MGRHARCGRGRENTRLAPWRLNPFPKAVERQQGVSAQKQTSPTRQRQPEPDQHRQLRISLWKEERGDVPRRDGRDAIPEEPEPAAPPKSRADRTRSMWDATSSAARAPDRDIAKPNRPATPRDSRP